MVNRPDYQVQVDDSRLELRRSGKASVWAGAASLSLAVVFPSLGCLQPFREISPVLQGVSALLAVCGLLLLLRACFPGRGWVLDRACGCFEGSGKTVPFGELGPPVIVDVPLGSSRVFALILPVRGQAQRLLSDIDRGPVERTFRELHRLLEGEAEGLPVSLAASRMGLRRVLAGATLLGVSLVWSLGLWWVAPNVRYEGMRLWVLGLIPLWAGFWESAGQPVLPPARGALVWGNYLFIVIVALCSL